MEDTSVYAGVTREKTIPRTVRMPLSLYRMLEAVREKDRDETLNDAAVKCLRLGVEARLKPEREAA